MLLFCDGFDDYGSAFLRYDIVQGGGGGSFGISTLVPSRTGRACLLKDDERFGFTSSPYVGKNIPGTQTVIVGFALFINVGAGRGGSVPDRPVLNLIDGFICQIDLRITGTGQFYFTRNGTTLGTPTSVGFTFNTWHYMEAKVTIDPSAGVCILRCDGAQFINLTSQNTRASANSQCSQVALGDYLFIGNQADYQYYAWDDFYICDTTGSVNNSFLGDVSVKSAVPTGLGTLNQYTQNAITWPTSTVMWLGRRIKDSNSNIQEVTACTSDVKTGGSAPTWNVSLGGTTVDNHVTWTNRGADSQILEVNEVPLMGLLDLVANKVVPLGQAIIDPNLNVQMVTTSGTTAVNPFVNSWNTAVGGTTATGTATYTNQGTLASFEDLYISDSTVTDQSRFTFPSITASTVYAVAITMRVRKDDSSNRAVRGVTKSGGTTGTSPTDLYLSTTYQLQQGILETDPNTGVAWTQSGVNAAEFGIETTV